jgi:cytochrome c551/c552
MKPLLALLAVLAVAHVGPTQANMDLAREKNCLACHAVDKPLLGPAYQDVAARYRGQSGAVDMLTAKVLKGGAGVWGTMPMPPGQVTPAQARQLVQWVLAAAPDAGPSQAPASSRSMPLAPVEAAASPPPATPAKRPEPSADPMTVERGKYLVNSVLACGNCHSPRAADGTPIAGRELTGGRSFDTPMFYVTPGNLSSDPETGLGKWSADDIKRALIQGVRPNGLPLALMPVAYFKALTEQDLGAVTAYLMSLPPQHNPSLAPVYRKPFDVAEVPDAKRPFTEREASGDLVSRGRYLATLAHCLDCHTPIVNGKTDLTADGGRGGRRMGPEQPLTPNITPNPTAGIGSWTDAEIRRALTQGVSRDGRLLQFPMPWPFLATLREGDVDALVAWMRSMPAKE